MLKDFEVSYYAEHLLHLTLAESLLDIRPVNEQ